MKHRAIRGLAHVHVCIFYRSDVDIYIFWWPVPLVSWGSISTQVVTFNVPGHWTHRQDHLPPHPPVPIGLSLPVKCFISVSTILYHRSLGPGHQLVFLCPSSCLLGEIIIFLKFLFYSWQQPWYSNGCKQCKPNQLLRVFCGGRLYSHFSENSLCFWDLWFCVCVGELLSACLLVYLCLKSNYLFYLSESPPRHVFVLAICLCCTFYFLFLL